MIYCTGDIHGNQCMWIEKINHQLSSADAIIVCGDFGIGFWDGPNWTEEMFFDFISEQDYLVLFIDGNHENFHKLNNYPIELWNGGRVHKIRHNLIHLMRGEVYHIEGNTIFTFGGGYSIDKARRQEDISWWPQEMPSEDEYRNAEHNLQKVEYRVDYIITHTAPSETVYYLSTMRRHGVQNDVVEEWPLTSFFDDIRKKVTYSHWYFGHFHVDEELWRNQTAMLSTIRELESGRIVKQWGPSEDEQAYINEVGQLS